MICYLSRNYKGINSAGNKAKVDVEQIMETLGYRNVGLRQTRYENTISAFFITLFGVLKCAFCLRKGDTLILQYPLKKYYTFVCNIAHLHGCKVVTLIHDLGSFRRKRLTEYQEVVRLNHSDYIIAHNPSMRKWLEERNCRAKVGVLGIFDYLSSSQPCNEIKECSAYRILYAGGLSHRKNAFLYKVGSFIKVCKFVLCGGGFEYEEAEGKERFEYRGFLPSDQLIEKADADFGLVWDGTSATTCAGNFGEYLKYNNPHKTSLYIRCGLPVIIWDKAALSPFVRENAIGICVTSLEELDERLSALSMTEYDKMKQNVSIIARNMAVGYYFSTAVKEAQGYLEEKL